jgi:predicted dienelactone hydrolase
MWRISSVVTATLLGTLLGCQPVLPAANETPTDQTTVLASSMLRAERHIWFDASRQRSVPARIYVPSVGQPPYPTIIVSPGVGAGDDCFTNLALVWAEYGYVVVVVTHTDTSAAAMSDPNNVILNVPVGLFRVPTDAELRVNHPLDLSFVLDQVASDARLSALVDWSRVGAAGHSFGAFTVLALAGVQFRGPGDVIVRMRDTRIRAVAAMAPPGVGALGLDEHSWDTLETPCLSIFGTQDTDVATYWPWARRATFELSPTSDRYLVTVQGGTHNMYDKGSSEAVDQLLYQAFHTRFELLTTAFFETYLNGDRRAQAILTSRVVDAFTVGLFITEWRDITPLATES